MKYATPFDILHALQVNFKISGYKNVTYLDSNIRRWKIKE